MNLSIENRVALITGASKGMGKAISLALAKEGARVCMVARTESALHTAAEDIRKLTAGEVMTIAGDVNDVALAAKVEDTIRQHWGAVDILVNNAGGPPPGPFLEQDETAWANALNQNFLSVVRFTSKMTPGMKANKWGRIISLTSTIAKEPSPGMVLSACARAAVSAFTKAISIELAPYNITVNTICPGGVQTERAVNLIKSAAEREHKSVDEIFRRSVSGIPIQRFADPAEIASVAAFLASEQSGYLTGVSLMVDGGLTKSLF